MSKLVLDKGTTVFETTQEATAFYNYDLGGYFVFYQDGTIAISRFHEISNRCSLKHPLARLTLKRYRQEIPEMVKRQPSQADRLFGCKEGSEDGEKAIDPILFYQLSLSYSDRWENPLNFLWPDFSYGRHGLRIETRKGKRNFTALLVDKWFLDNDKDRILFTASSNKEWLDLLLICGYLKESLVEYADCIKEFASLI